MSVVARCGSVVVLLSLLAGVAPAMAQPSPNEASGSSWTDPPSRGPAGADSPAVVKPAGTDASATGSGDAKPTEPKAAVASEAPAGSDPSKPVENAGAPARLTPAEKAAAVLGVKPVAGGQNMAASRVGSPGPRRVARPRLLAESRALRRGYRPRVATRPTREARRRSIVERSSRRIALGRRQPRSRDYAWIPDPTGYGRADPYDAGDSASAWTSRRLNGWEGLLGDSRASRIAQARAAGYKVMRSRTYQYPDGRRVRLLLPYEPAGFGDLD